MAALSIVHLIPPKCLYSIPGKAGITVNHLVDSDSTASPTVLGLALMCSRGRMTTTLKQLTRQNLVFFLFNALFVIPNLSIGR